MGGMFRDYEEDQAIEREMHITNVMECSTDTDLIDFTARSRSPLIMRIRSYGKPLSRKQRYCLARWIVEND